MRMRAILAIIPSLLGIMLFLGIMLTLIILLG